LLDQNLIKIATLATSQNWPQKNSDIIFTYLMYYAAY
jgi:hypothetical protein